MYSKEKKPPDYTYIIPTVFCFPHTLPYIMKQIIMTILSWFFIVSLEHP